MSGHDVLVANISMFLTAVRESKNLRDSQIDELGGVVAAARLLLGEFKFRNRDEPAR